MEKEINQVLHISDAFRYFANMKEKEENRKVNEKKEKMKRKGKKRNNGIIKQREKLR